MLELLVNGERRLFEQVETIADLVTSLNLEGRRVAVECNSQIVPRSQYAVTRLSDKDELEVVVAVGGG